MGNEYPDDLIINCFNTNKLPISKIREIILNNFYDLNLTKIINVLDLKKPIYANTSVYGHFGNEKFS
ncbi:methionine adenosyltransferase domain-containing protein [bacterium]|nr:methionine adenosyltransferase domain-containing protein [bacterium]